MSDENARLEELEENAVIDETEQDEFVPPIQYDISSYGADYDVEGLVKRLERSDILIPSFQRNYVWKQKEASRFIESLLLGLPVPGVFLAREKGSNKLLVIDGQQRLKTLQFFYSGYFNPQPGETKSHIFRLIDVQQKFEGLTFTTLEENDRIKLNDSLIHATIIRQESPNDDDTSIYHIFDRLNSQGQRLTPQEIRTAIDHGTFIDLIKDLNEYENWRMIFGKKSPRLKDQELILRFLAFYFNGDKYERPVNEFLNKFSENHKKADEKFLQKSRKVFCTTIDLIFRNIGKQAFRPTSTINAAVFDSVMVGLAKRLEKGDLTNSDKIKGAYDLLLADSEYLKLISTTTSDDSNVRSRISKATQVFSKL